MIEFLATLWSKLRKETTPASITGAPERSAGPAAQPRQSTVPNAAEYRQKWDTLKIDPGRGDEVNAIASRISAGKYRYLQVTAQTGVPWQIVGVIHNMECALSFAKHLHNGDPLTARTRQIPSGRPKTGTPPFTWLESAVDAMEIDGFAKWQDWSPEGALYMLERYNGMGYRKRGEDNPYLWAGSNHSDERGKFVQDGKFDKNAISKQIGVALLLKALWG